MSAGSADVQRWSEEVARDPDSLAFLPLADAYRRQGKREAALKLCLRGLARHPEHMEAHALLARLYLEAGERQKAADEWGVMLRLDEQSFEANRGMGFFYLERGEHEAARRHLERAATARPADPTVRDALALLERRASGTSGTGAGQAAEPGAAEPPADPVPEPSDPPADAPREASRAPADPGRVFESLKAQAPFRGAVLFDRAGLSLAGTLPGGGARVEALGAMLGEAVEEAVRTVQHLELGDWEGLLMETEQHAVHIAPVDDEHLVLFAAAADAPAGWVLRSAARAAELARDYLERGV